MKNYVLLVPALLVSFCTYPSYLNNIDVKIVKEYPETQNVWDELNEVIKIFRDQVNVYHYSDEEPRDFEELKKRLSEATKNYKSIKATLEPLANKNPELRDRLQNQFKVSPPVEYVADTFDVDLHERFISLIIQMRRVRFFRDRLLDQEVKRSEEEKNRLRIELRKTEEPLPALEAALLNLMVARDDALSEEIKKSEPGI